MVIKLDPHTHTIVSGHAYSTLLENAAAASAIGLEIMAVTDHGPKMPGGPHQIYFMNLDILPRVISGVEILRGVEANIIDHKGTLDIKDEILKDLDLVIASLHPPCVPPGAVSENTGALIGAMSNPNVKILGHLGDPRYPLDIPAVIKAAKSWNIIIEINNHSLDTRSFRSGGADTLRDIIRECIDNEVFLILGSDAHFASKVGDFTHARKMADELNTPASLLLNYDPLKFKEAIGFSLNNQGESYGHIG